MGNQNGKSKNSNNLYYFEPTCNSCFCQLSYSCSSSINDFMIANTPELNRKSCFRRSLNVTLRFLDKTNLLKLRQFLWTETIVFSKLRESWWWPLRFGHPLFFSFSCYQLSCGCISRCFNLPHSKNVMSIRLCCILSGIILR